MVDLASAAGSPVTEVAEAFGVAPSQLYAWRKQMAGGELDADQRMATFARIDVSDLPGVERPVADCPDPAGRIVVAFASGPRPWCQGFYAAMNLNKMEIATRPRQPQPRPAAADPDLLRRQKGEARPRQAQAGA
ncbi:transposase [Mesorhizobium sp. M0809]|uniref:transposase n=1 Tax=Mesorhizobium sp. M0809 TaxID=2957003 RepID=UPI00333C21AF